MGLKIAFYILSLVLLGSAIYAIQAKSVIRSAFSLIICFLSVAGIFITLSAEFLAIIQVMVYIGAVAVLIIMTVMMTKQNEAGNKSNKLKIPAIIGALCIAALGCYTALTSKFSGTNSPIDIETDTLGVTLFDQSGYVLLVIIAALIILTAIVGAITVAREK